MSVHPDMSGYVKVEEPREPFVERKVDPVRRTGRALAALIESDVASAQRLPPAVRDAEILRLAEERQAEAGLRDGERLEYADPSVRIMDLVGSSIRRVIVPAPGTRVLIIDTDEKVK